MSFAAQLRAMNATIKRLEAAAGKGRRCASCRLSLRRSWPDPKKPTPRPEDVIKAKCEFCSSEYTVALTGLTGVEREAIRLSYSYTVEYMYTDPRAHALGEWLGRRPKRGSEVKRRAPARAKDDPNARALAKLREERDKLFERKLKTLRAKYGESPFPEQLELIAAVVDRQRSNKRSGGNYVKGLFELEMAETDYMVCAELEKIIWGHTSPETAAAIEKLGREIDELVVTAREKAEREKEERRLKDLAFLNKNRASCGLPPLPDDPGRS